MRKAVWSAGRAVSRLFRPVVEELNARLTPTVGGCASDLIAEAGFYVPDATDAAEVQVADDGEIAVTEVGSGEFVTEEVWEMSDLWQEYSEDEGSVADRDGEVTHLDETMYAFRGEEAEGIAIVFGYTFEEASDAQILGEPVSDMETEETPTEYDPVIAYSMPPLEPGQVDTAGEAVAARADVAALLPNDAQDDTTAPPAATASQEAATEVIAWLQGDRLAETGGIQTQDGTNEVVLTTHTDGSSDLTSLQEMALVDRLG